MKRLSTLYSFKIVSHASNDCCTAHPNGYIIIFLDVMWIFLSRPTWHLTSCFTFAGYPDKCGDARRLSDLFDNVLIYNDISIYSKFWKSFKINSLHDQVRQPPSIRRWRKQHCRPDRRLGQTIQQTTPNSSAGFQMMLLASITWTGCAGHPGFPVPNVHVTPGGAWKMAGGGVKRAAAEFP